LRAVSSEALLTSAGALSHEADAQDEFAHFDDAEMHAHEALLHDAPTRRSLPGRFARSAVARLVRIR
jgi:hypothetical protein